MGLPAGGPLKIRATGGVFKTVIHETVRQKSIDNNCNRSPFNGRFCGLGKIMKTNVQQTSIEAYSEHAYKATQLERIARFMLSHHRPEGWTIGEVVKALSMEKSTVSARMNKLKNMPTVYVDFAEYDMLQVTQRPCKISGVKCQAWVLAPRGVQLQLFN